MPHAELPFGSQPHRGEGDLAQPYLDRLAAELKVWRPAKPRGVELECKHFFTGAALYADGEIAATLTPKGLALKLPVTIREELYRSRRARRLRYFAGGPVKKDYALLSRLVVADLPELRRLLSLCIRFVGSRAAGLVALGVLRGAEW